MGTSLVVQWLRLHASTAGGGGSIPGQGTKIPHALGHGQKKKKKRREVYLFGNTNKGITELKTFRSVSYRIEGFPGGSEVKASASHAGDPGLIPGLGRSPGEGNGNPLQYSCLENPVDEGAWRATVHGVTKSQTQLSDFTHSLNG